MIAVVDVKIQAENPNMPLFPWRAFAGSPSSLRIRNVPKRVGQWCLNRVYVAVEYPDNTTQTFDCTLVGGVYVGTICGSTIAGEVSDGYTIYADGVDENGSTVEGYVLGKGNVYILENDSETTSADAKWTMRLLSAQPSSPAVGDAYISSDALHVIDADGVEKIIGDIPESLSVYSLSASEITFFGESLSDILNTKQDALTEAQLSAIDEVQNKQDKLTEAQLSAIDEVQNKQNAISANGILSSDNNGNVTSADVSSVILATEDVWTATGFPGWNYVYDVGEYYNEYENQWYYDITVTSCDNPDWRYTAVNVPYVSYSRLDTVVFHECRDWGDDPDNPLATYDLTATVQRSRNKLGLVTYDDIIVSGILSSDGQGNITSADMSMYVKQNDSPMFNGLTAFGTNYIEGYASLYDLSNALSGALSNYATQEWVTPRLSYSLLSSGSVQLEDRAIQHVSLELSTTVFTLPQLIPGKVNDFVLDVTNTYTEGGTPAAAAFSLNGTIGTDFNLVVPKDESFAEMTTLEAGEMAEFYFTRTSFELGGLPTWKVVKQVVDQYTPTAI